MSANQRIGDESRRLGFAQRQELEWDRGAASFDGTAVPGINLDDLSSDRLDEYRQALASASPGLTLKARDLITKDGQITVAANLLFAQRPQREFPSAYVRVLKYSTEERGVGRTHTLHDGDHIRVEIFPNLVEITSPGRFPGTVNPVEPQSISRSARNPRVARVCSDLAITQELGEGIRRIFSEMRRLGLTDPMYIQSAEAVRLTLLASNAVSEGMQSDLGPGAMRILDALRLAGRPLGTGQVVELVDLARPTVLRHLNRIREAGLVAWEGESLRDSRVTWRVK